MTFGFLFCKVFEQFRSILSASLTIYIHSWRMNQTVKKTGVTLTDENILNKKTVLRATSFQRKCIWDWMFGLWSSSDDTVSWTKWNKFVWTNVRTFSKMANKSRWLVPTQTCNSIPWRESFNVDVRLMAQCFGKPVAWRTFGGPWRCN